MKIIKNIIRFEPIGDSVSIRKVEDFIQLEFVRGEMTSIMEYEINELTYLEKPIIKIFNLEKEIILISDENGNEKRIYLEEDFHLFSINIILHEKSLIISGILINENLQEGVAACSYELNYKNYELILNNFQTVTNWRNEILNSDDLNLDELFSLQ